MKLDSAAVSVPLGGVARINLIEHRIQCLSIQQSTIQYDSADTPSVLNVVQWIRFQEYKIRHFSGFHRAQRVYRLEILRCTERGRSNDLPFGHPNFDEQGELVMKTETRQAVEISGV